MQPCIVLHGCKDSVIQPATTTIMMDGITIAASDEMDVTLAFSCLMAAYFVYGIQYPRKLRNTLIFMERCVFGITSAESSTDKVPYTVQRAGSMLCA